MTVPRIGAEGKQAPAPKMTVVSARYTFAAPATVTAVSVNVVKASGRITFQVVRPQGSAAACQFDVVTQWTTPFLINVGYQKVRGF